MKINNILLILFKYSTYQYIYIYFKIYIVYIIMFDITQVNHLILV